MSPPAPPQVSVVMPVFNGARFLERAIESVRHQTLPGWELLAVDDHSADESGSLLARAAAADARVRVFRHPANLGQSAARNTALANARGELVAYLDQDDEFYPDHLARAWDWRAKGEVLVFRYDLVDDMPGSPAFGTVVTYDPAAKFDRMLAETITTPLGVVHHRRLLDRVGGFDEDLGRFRGDDEDGDLWQRFARAGAVFLFVPAASGRYHVRADSFSRTRPPGPAGPPVPGRPERVGVGGTTYPVRVPDGDGDAWLVGEVFDGHAFGGIPRWCLRPSAVVADVGASAGLFAVYFKLHYDSAAVVHCFEPDPSQFALLAGNVRPFPGVVSYPFGLARADGEVDLFLHPHAPGATAVGEAPVPPAVGRTRVRVRDAAVAWDELGLGEVDVLKVDALGCEVDVLGVLGPRARAARVVVAEFRTPADRSRIGAALPGHELFGTRVRESGPGLVTYVRSDLMAPAPAHGVASSSAGMESAVQPLPPPAPVARPRRSAPGRTTARGCCSRRTTTTSTRRAGPPCVPATCSRR
ncbi:FkbM family methyltransferase [Fimbriiglobus ruber]|uniref:Beta-1,3-glucosyltransferase n=1 Tax=Fimbriiglobus ruber TaxID=1908690 RepID=A0A225DW14_9BACT|nr:FkbM family methyltransferase [Fimbriiglobus ruber]OWK41826.1 Beta-1,3-glucosyltransferase [Fimbriiglobus ruber]